MNTAAATHRIVRRAFSEYTTVETFVGSWLEAMNRADALQRDNNDGEYLLRGVDEPNWRPGSSYQSPMDWL
ncbi:hypothetical protein FJV76_14405 [Mesorhizobium sp. WSM4303]|uniref:hypothetical protein n=1 Tax=Mesorhizobium sp. WSM4303 TaxID=2589887 RepID=UPI00115CD654|nr:hypothetical protein [Mesorhizobium sp. WSM4303]TRD03823.1 hypothetical protein FJV76_14405 [Mesorhizobium sp. WSM4303]